MNSSETKIRTENRETCKNLSEVLRKDCALFNPLMSGGNKKGHTYLNKPAAERCRFV